MRLFQHFVVLHILLLWSFLNASSPDIAQLKQTSQAFNSVAQKGQASVVSISALKTVNQRYRSFFNDPFFDQFNTPYHGNQQQREGLGSGVIVSKSGHILTNHHVVARTDSITVTLNDGREFSATLVGSDKKTDIALLKIEATNLPIVRLGNSDQLSIEIGLLLLEIRLG